MFFEAGHQLHHVAGHVSAVEACRTALERIAAVKASTKLATDSGVTAPFEDVGTDSAANCNPAAQPSVRASSAATLGSTSCTRPMACARWASKRCPTLKSARAWDSPILGSTNVLITAGMIPSLVSVKPKRVDVVASAFRGAPGVEQVPDTRKLLDNLFAVLSAVTWVARGLAVVMAVTAVLLIATTVRLSAFSRRREIGIMRLVGAPSWLIQLPFLMEAVLATIVGTVLATGLLYLGVQSGITGFLAPRVPSLQFISVDELWAIAPLLLAAGVLLAMLSSVVTLRRYLRV